MRPENLNYLFKNISSLSGIGPKLEILFDRLVGNKIVNLLWHLPYNIIKREMHENIYDANINSIITIKIKILEHQASRFKKQPYVVNCICGETPLMWVYLTSG